jgi:putative membrane protein
LGNALNLVVPLDRLTGMNFATPFQIPGQKAKKETPLDILKARYALGEINEEAFLAKRKLIEA